MKTNLIGVYGTLRIGGTAQGLMEGFRYVGQDSISAEMYDLGPFPGIILKEIGNENPVIVDVFEIPDYYFLKSLDRYEGYFEEHPEQSLYIRKIVPLLERNTEEIYAYEYNHSTKGRTRILSGDWFHRYDSSEGFPD